MPRVHYNGSSYESREAESVLDTLLRHGVEANYSCRKGSCLTCMMRAVEGEAPAAAQAGLRETLKHQGYFLSCLHRPKEDIAVAPGEDAALFQRAVVLARERLAPDLCRIILEPATPLYYHAGQFMNLRRADGLSRSYSLASVPTLDRHLEFHVKRLPGGQMSNWIFDRMKVGESIDIQGPHGDCFYLPGEPGHSILMIGTGSGLAPLQAIARDALSHGHSGPIRLYHGSRTADGLYLRDALRALAGEYANFRYTGCLSGAGAPAGFTAGRADEIALGAYSDLAGWRVYLCGNPPMVAGAKKRAFLAGADLKAICADAFELRELRAEPRDNAA
jgi:CDP-4-dehydro-6-deoxyglucose reductase